MKKLSTLIATFKTTFLFAITTNVRDQAPATLLNSLNKHIKGEIAAPIAIISLVIAGIYFIVGKNDATEKLSNIGIGLAVIACSTAIASWFF